MRPSDRLHIAGAVVALLALSSAGRASAADLLRLSGEAAPIPSPAPPESGWYLRGDATVSHFGKPADATPPNPADPGMPPLVGLRLGNETGYGGGIGYRIDGGLRVDATFDRRAAAPFRTYSSRSTFATGYNIEAGDLDLLTGLVTAYADLGTWWGLTPYVGAGVGFADNTFHGNYTQTTCTIAACDGNPGTGARTPVSRPDHGFPSFAWSLTAGVSYPILSSLSLDAAYRYVDLGAARSGVDTYGGSTRLKDLTSNELRLGLRYRFAGGLLPVASGNPYGN